MHNNNLLLKNKNITVIGAGVIGSSWAALFLSAGMNVTVNDFRENIAQSVKEYIINALEDLTKINKNAIAINNEYLDKHLFFEKDVAKAVANADYIQENITEKLDAKIELWGSIEEMTPSHTIFLSSSSGIIASKQAIKLKNPTRLIIGHPFNPPHLLPLVEVVPGEHKDEAIIKQVLDFYTALGKIPKLINKEISGFVANRLQTAIFRECVYLVEQDVIKANELDDVITSSLGIRWAVDGPFLSFHLGGGAGGIKHFLAHLGPGLEAGWTEQVKNTVSLTDSLKDKIANQIADSYEKKSITELEESRDTREIAIIETLNNYK